MINTCNEENVLLGCSSVLFGEGPTFRRNLSSASSGPMSTANKMIADLVVCFFWFLVSSSSLELEINVVSQRRVVSNPHGVTNPDGPNSS
jgi:hypothetical protein